MDWQQYIERNPEVLLSKPVIKGTRISVELIMRKLAVTISHGIAEKNLPNAVNLYHEADQPIFVTITENKIRV